MIYILSVPLPAGFPVRRVQRSGRLIEAVTDWFVSLFFFFVVCFFLNVSSSMPKHARGTGRVSREKYKERFSFYILLLKFFLFSQHSRIAS